MLNTVERNVMFFFWSVISLMKRLPTMRLEENLLFLVEVVICLSKDVHNSHFLVRPLFSSTIFTSIIEWTIRWSLSNQTNTPNDHQFCTLFLYRHPSDCYSRNLLCYERDNSTGGSHCEDSRKMNFESRLLLTINPIPHSHYDESVVGELQISIFTPRGRRYLREQHVDLHFNITRRFTLSPFSILKRFGNNEEDALVISLPSASVPGC